WGADTGAYFAGRRFGKHKLAPKVSPGKTWEGVAGASVVTIVVAIGSLYWLQIESAYTLYFILLCIVTMVVSILGDLYESLYKRRAQIKDSGAIFPGHGGVLDRIDSMTAAAPMFSIGLLLLGV
ncbi:MAG: phosphatidate cytidylyltransferase, partial [Gammaproteobacteria bacterium]|nr:phosphatidate cytidylyltransferase [Gammaproteobacteria bacterium]